MKFDSLPDHWLPLIAHPELMVDSNHMFVEVGSTLNLAGVWTPGFEVHDSAGDYESWVTVSRLSPDDAGKLLRAVRESCLRQLQFCDQILGCLAAGDPVPAPDPADVPAYVSTYIAARDRQPPTANSLRDH